MSATVLVTGGTGTLGRLAVTRLLGAGYDVRVLSRRPRPDPDATSPVHWCVGDLSNGNGLDAALDGVATVLHCATRMRGDLVMAQRLSDAANRNGRPHIVYVSIVGCDRIPYRYYRTKHAVEELLERSGLPWTVQRATQFHQLVLQGCALLARLPLMPVPAATSFQSIAAADVADRLVQLIGSGPSTRAPDLAGPQVVSARDLANAYLNAAGKHRRVVEVRLPGAVFAGYRSGAHLAPERADGRVTFAEHCAAALRG